ncbi:MAG: insulinase family protein [Elusimicrobia bacterium]|nr:insulinase family protein [Elusimicrobiota bacterium]
MEFGTWNILWAVPPNYSEIKPLEFKVPKARRFNLTNGAAVYFLEDHELPQVRLTLIFRAGSIHDPKEKLGLASLAAAVLPYGGAKKIPADQITQELELLGSRLEAAAGHEDFSVDLFSLTKNFPRTLELLSQIMTAPYFDAKKLEIEKKKAVADIERRNDEPRAIVSREFFRLIYGPASPWGRRTEIETVKSVSRRDLQDFYRRLIFPANGVIAVSGDISEPQLRSLVEPALGAARFPAAVMTVPSVGLEAEPLARRVILIIKESAQQTAIRLGHLGVERHHPDFFKLKVLDEILGGGFSSRLFRNVRSRQGLAYSVGSALTTPAANGVLMAGIGTKSETTLKAIEEVVKEIESMRSEPPSVDEMTIAKNQIVYSFMQNFNASHQSATQIAQADLFGYASDYLETYRASIESVSAADVLKAAQKYWHPDQLVILAAGNPEKFDRSLETLGPLKILDPESGNFVEPQSHAAKNAPTIQPQ